MVEAKYYVLLELGLIVIQHNVIKIGHMQAVTFLAN